MHTLITIARVLIIKSVIYGAKDHVKKLKILYKCFSLDFIWYYPKSKTGTAVCWESGLQAKLVDFLTGLNR
jgi:hypothetical protein